MIKYLIIIYIKPIKNTADADNQTVLNLHQHEGRLKTEFMNPRIQMCFSDDLYLAAYNPVKPLMTVRNKAFRSFRTFRQTEGFAQNDFVERKRIFCALNRFGFGFRA